MSRSTFTFGQYSLTGGTSVVEVVCGFLLKTLKEGSLESSPPINEIVKQLREHVTVDYGFVRIELPELKYDDFKYFTEIVSRCIVQIQSWEDRILIDEVKKMQENGFLLQEAKYTQDIPTYYILDFFNQLMRMLMLRPDHDLSKEDQSTNFSIVKKTG